MSRPPSTERPADRSAQPKQRVRSRRLLIALATSASTLSVALGGVYLVRSSTAPTVLLDVTDAAADQPPATVAPIEQPPVPSTVPDAPGAGLSRGEPVSQVAAHDRSDSLRRRQATADRLPRRDDSMSPLADLLGPAGTAVVPPVVPRPRPVAIEIDSIDVTPFAIRDVGLEDDGQLQIPDETEIGWYRYGATAGRPGSTVLAAHVSWNDTTGPFFELGSVEPGNRVSVALDDGVTRHYEVVERTMYDKNELPRERIWRTTGAEELVLITCGGDFNPDIRRYRQNIVVYAVPVA